jgi:hypothetical protein
MAAQMSASFDLFIERVHNLLQAGYSSLTQEEIKHYNRCHEPDITGGLAMRIQQLIDAKQVLGISRAWCVVDNWPEAAPHLPLKKQPKAKKRKMPDLRFRYGGLRQALYFRFEAKKLASTGDYGDLISHEDGLGRFLREVYGRDDKAGGLLGYVQTETVEIHSERVKTALASNRKKYQVSPGGDWAVASWKTGPKCCFRVAHSRKGGSVIVIFYSFLSFRGTGIDC